MPFEIAMKLRLHANWTLDHVGCETVLTISVAQISLIITSNTYIIARLKALATNVLKIQY